MQFQASGKWQPYGDGGKSGEWKCHGIDQLIVCRSQRNLQTRSPRDSLAPSQVWLQLVQPAVRESITNSRVFYIVSTFYELVHYCCIVCSDIGVDGQGILL